MAFQFQSVGRLAGHREGTVQHGTVIGMNADEIHAVVQALGVELHRVTINLLHHHALADSIVNLKANHALAFDVQHVGSRVRIDFQALFEFVDTFHPSLESGFGAIESIAIDNGVGPHHIFQGRRYSREYCGIR